MRSKAVLSYNLASGFQVELNNTWYQNGQTAINNNYREDRKFILSLPFRGPKFSAYSRITLQQVVLPTTKYSTAEWLISGAMGNLVSSINSYALLIDKGHPYVYSHLTMAARVSKNMLYAQHIRCEYVSGKIAGLKSDIEKRVFNNGFLNFSYENNFSSNINNFELGLCYTFSFAQSGSAVRKSNQAIRYIQSISGSVIYDPKSRYSNFNNGTSVGEGAIILAPFLDLNGDNLLNAGEPKAAGLNVRVSNGRIIQNARDTSILITHLESYSSVNIELDESGFTEIPWKLLKKNYRVAIDPNLLKKIDIPIFVAGEVSGKVMSKSGGNETGMAGVLISIYDSKMKLITTVISEEDGYFSYLGLRPGSYQAQIATTQNGKLPFTTIPKAIPFTILLNKDGSVVDGVTFLFKEE